MCKEVSHQAAVTMGGSRGFGGVAAFALGALGFAQVASAQVSAPSTAPSVPSAAPAPSSTASPTSGPPQDDPTTRARALFAEGTDLAHRGEWASALSAFERSQALRSHAVTAYNVGYCERALGHYTRARKMLGEALAENAAHGGVELPDDLATGAKNYLAELEKQIARVVVTLTPEGASLLVDGRPLERASGGLRPVVWAGTRDLGPAESAPAATFQLDVDPGAHVFVASADGYVQNASTHSFETGPESNLVLQLASVAAASAAPNPPRGREGASGQATGHSNVPMFLALGGGAVGLLGGTVAGILAISFKGEGGAHQGDAGTAADWSTAGFIAGGLGIATAGVLWLTAPKDAATTTITAGPALAGGGRSDPLEVRIAPWISPWGAGVTGRF